MSDYTAREYDVFLSYAHLDADHDAANAGQLARWLESLGYSVWWDHSLIAGQKWPKELEIKVRGSKRVIVLWSPRAAASTWVSFETNLAWNEDKLIPLVVEKHPVPSHWAADHRVVVTDFEAQKAEILKVLAIEPSGSKPREGTDDARVSIAALPTASGALIGRDVELAMLKQAWASTAPAADPSQKTNIVVLHAIGGAGKTALMRHFLEGLADTDFASADKVFGWSAYSQGSGDNKTANADEVIARALGFFGHDLARDPIQDPVERGRKLAHLVGERRSLLILDGLEPLQDLPLVNGGRLKDPGLAALVKELAAHNKGLVVITSRQELPELTASTPPRVINHALDRLDEAAGVALLAHLGVHGKRSEMEAAVEDVLGHALSLNLLGTYLDAVFSGDVNQREHFKLGEIEDAPADLVGDQTARFAKRAVRIMEGTIARFESVEGRSTDGAETAILHMVGLFNRPAEKEALDGLLAEPLIPGLTDAFHALAPQPRRARWNVAVDRLRKLRLLNREDLRGLGSLDAHPIVRAHFGSRLQHRAPEAFREAHSRLYDFYRFIGLPQAFRTSAAYGLLALKADFAEHFDMLWRDLCDGSLPNGYREQLTPSIAWLTPPQLKEFSALSGTAAFEEALRKFLPGDLNGMRPCFSAIVHGCAAGRHQEAYREVYSPRARRGKHMFISKELGAHGADLAALAPFFSHPWKDPVDGLGNIEKSRVLNYSAYALRGLGRLREALEPFQDSLEATVALEDWANAGSNACSLSELFLELGYTSKAVSAAKLSVIYADRSDDHFRRSAYRTALADALHQTGQLSAANLVFKEAEDLFRLLAGNTIIYKQDSILLPLQPCLSSLQGYQYCDLILAQGGKEEVLKRIRQLQQWQDRHANFRDSALYELAAGRALASVSDDLPRLDDLELSRKHLDAAVKGLRCSGREDYLPWGLLARAAFRRIMGEFRDAAVDLDETFEIAQSGEMCLHLTDYNLESSRLLLTQIAAELEAAEAGVIRAMAEEYYAAAKKLIEDTGYKRRMPELDAIRACLDDEIPPSILDPDRDRNGRPSAEQR